MKERYMQVFFWITYRKSGVAKESLCCWAPVVHCWDTDWCSWASDWGCFRSSRPGVWWARLKISASSSLSSSSSSASLNVERKEESQKGILQNDEQEVFPRASRRKATWTHVGEETINHRKEGERKERKIYNTNHEKGKGQIWEVDTERLSTNPGKSSSRYKSSSKLWRSS